MTKKGGCVSVNVFTFSEGCVCKVKLVWTVSLKNIALSALANIACNILSSTWSLEKKQKVSVERWLTDLVEEGVCLCVCICVRHGI